MSFINTHQVISYLKYYSRAKTIYSVHSPFMYEIIKELVQNKKGYYAFIEIEQLKRRLSIDQKQINLQDLGAGSKTRQSNQKTVSEILKTSVSSDQKCKILFHLSRVLKPRLSLELGTSLGISAMSIAQGDPQMTLHTIEGDPELRNIAQSHFQSKKLKIISHQGSFDEILPNLLADVHKIDFVFIDGNHTYESTIRYHQMIKPKLSENAVILYDDIYWSKGMTDAWLDLKADPDFQFSLDLFNFGILFKRADEVKKQDFTIIQSIKKPWHTGLYG